MVRSTIAALVPVKSFDIGKTRLAAALAPLERAVLAEQLASGVVKALAPLPVFVACEDAAVAAWAEGLGAHTCLSDLRGLNRVVRHGVNEVRERGFDRVLVAHGDLADPRGLPDLAAWPGVVLVPDRRLEGTNVLIVPTRSGFRFSYGPGSFARHLSEAERLGGEMHVIDDPGLALDLDDPDDLDAYHAAMTSGERPSPRER